MKWLGLGLDGLGVDMQRSKLGMSMLRLIQKARHLFVIVICDPKNIPSSRRRKPDDQKNDR